MLSEMQLFTLNMLEERLLQLWMLYMLLKDKEDLSMDLEHKNYILINYQTLLNIKLTFHYKIFFKSFFVFFFKIII